MKTKRNIIIITTVSLMAAVGFTFPSIRTFLDFDRFNKVRESSNSEYEKYDQGTEVSKNIRNEDLQVIASPCAVIVSPNSQKIANLKTENPVDDFNTIVDDNQYYLATSIQYLDSLKVKVIHRYSEGSLIFRTTKGTIFKFPADSIYWGVVLFNGKMKPIAADMTAIDQEYELYMRK